MSRTEAERIAVLETKFDELQKDLVSISGKLDELLELKTKGMGAVWLVGLIFGSGILGLVAFVSGFFKSGHL